MLEIEQKIISKCQQPLYASIWSPINDVLILGNGDNLVAACHQERCQQLGIKILRRKGGGGAVLLHKECIIVSIGTWVGSYFNNQRYFSSINDTIIKVLTKCHARFQQLSQRGISDIAYEEQKVAGTTVFRSKNYLLYQASLLYLTQVEKITAVLKQPTTIPAYRNNRTHEQFLIGLADIETSISKNKISETLNEHLANYLLSDMREMLIPPPANQVEKLQLRLN